jgi:NitT/TauT family transport system substrate-binding protein
MAILVRKAVPVASVAGIMALGVLLLSACGGTGFPGQSKQMKTLVIAEPVHSVGYAPIYAAIRKGYFAENGLKVEMLTATGGGHVPAVLSGEAWGFVGGPESNAMAAQQKPDDKLVSIVNIVNRANVYLAAKKGTQPAGRSKQELANFTKGKTIAASRHGGTPNLLVRWWLIDIGLDPEKDVRIEANADFAAGLTMVQQGAVDMAVTQEPGLSAGIRQGVWDEPFYSFVELGDYAFSVVSVLNSSIKKEPEVAQGFTRAIVKALAGFNDDRALALDVVKSEFPSMDEMGIKDSLDRAYADKIWSRDGFITKDALDKNMDVVLKTGVFQGTYSYDELINMQFVK